MAPHWPEEVDVFSVPHSRMKKLVHKYSNMITSTDFRDEYDLTTLLKNLMNVFSEFKAHEQIENMLIMRQLRLKLRAASVTSAAVCNCHNDNRLTDMLDLVWDGYSWAQKTEQERQLYGKKLKNALEDFTENFIPHMEEEEEVFQPMLMQYFTYEELKALKAKVIEEHYISKHKEEYLQEKFVEDAHESDEECIDVPKSKETDFSKVPDEICLKIFSYLDPKDLTRIGQVSQRWNSLSRDTLLWSRLYPVHWAQGNWTFYPEPIGGVDGKGLSARELKPFDEQEEYTVCIDEDADIDESSESDFAENVEDDSHVQILKEAKILTSIVKYLLPKVGIGIKVCDLAYSRGVSSSLVHKILKLCPNLEVLDLTHTRVGDAAFKEYGASGRQSKLKHLDLTGCENITDLTLFSLASYGGGCPHLPWTIGDYYEDRDDDEEGYYDEDKDEDEYETYEDEEVEIENPPLTCAFKRPTCCGRFSQSALISETTDSVITPLPRPPCVVSEISVEKTCCGGKRLSNNESPQCCRSQGRGSGPETNQQYISANTGNLQNCDVSDLRMVHDSDEASTCPVNVRSEVSSLSNDLVNLSLTPKFCTLNNSCDNNPTVPDSVMTGTSGSHHPQRTCGGVDGSTTCASQCTVSSSLSQNSSEENSLQRSCCGTADCCELTQPVEDTETNGVEDDGSSQSNMCCQLEYLSLNGCYGISDAGLTALAQGEGTPQLQHLDLSGCVSLTGSGLSQLVSTSGQLDHANLYYCDYMPGDPYPTSASGCRNMQCSVRFCCSMRE